ncbi:MAG: phosphohistidine phosphatase SixA [Spirochaetia bacterium]|jgi:phosphohistidine phosphatase
MEIYFLRHGDAGAAEGWKGSDAERPLSKEGTAGMEKEAAAIARLGPALDAILTSPLVRARQTAVIVAKKLRPAAALVVEERLAPGFGAAQLKRILKERRASRGLLLVGHEPDFSRVISACIGGGSVECKKGSLARVDIDDPNSLTGVLVWLLPPRVLAP